MILSIQLQKLSKTDWMKSSTTSFIVPPMHLQNLSILRSNNSEHNLEVLLISTSSSTDYQWSLGKHRVLRVSLKCCVKKINVGYSCLALFRISYRYNSCVFTHFLSADAFVCQFAIKNRLHQHPNVRQQKIVENLCRFSLFYAAPCAFGL